MRAEFVKLCRSFRELKEFCKQNPELDANISELEGHYIIWIGDGVKDGEAGS